MTRIQLLLWKKKDLVGLGNISVLNYYYSHSHYTTLHEKKTFKDTRPVLFTDSSDDGHFIKTN